ncbi:hypothetical protein FIE12Z_1465 [Fusarium flagelliforme]|uniref:Uncharacterized protein n=1 Tax=Fusarium flagelliforme TaxID=2675880 RepID=A0A395N423_9HYPO|nr:hypothetical protein FIE12Z_1465 [Fusarium flagelliforme]
MADQARIQDSKEKFQMAFDHAVREEQAAKAQYEQEESAGILAGLPFDAWVHQNYPAYIAAKHQYQAAREFYEMALEFGDKEGYQAWRDKVKKAAEENMGPGGPNWDLLLGPN